ncbi:TonB-dependent receptor [Psychroflexus gondwanensis]|nr:carboxypeptidase-like regulatory domain-containing protein [Psychroflexus gondwanensis]TXE19233.1 TonB-dependent receptor [Psychroflexus gondwanensis]
MNKLSILKHILPFLFVLIGMFSYSQTQIEGTIQDSLGNPIGYVNVLLQPVESSRILAYTATQQDGNYQLNVNKIGELKVVFVSLGYSKKEIIINLNGQESIEVNAVLFEEEMLLENVNIEGERPISIKKDTIIFDADSFRRGSEVVVEDLLKNLPGVQVDGDGTIKVGDREIERLMVDGDDLFEKGYKVLSKNMTSDAVDKIEIYDKYSSNKLLKGIEESDRVAMNIKLKDDYNQQWFGNADVGIGGLDKLYQKNRVNLMSFGKKSKYYFLGNSNNIGEDAIGDVSQMIRPMRFNQPGSVGDGERASSLISLYTNVPQLKRERTNFNDSRLVSLNAIHNLSEDMKLRTLGFFNWDKNEFFRNTATQFLLNDKNFTNTEDFSLTKNKFLGFGKMDYTYDISDNQMLEYTGSFNSSDINSDSNLIFNGNSTLESLQDDNQQIDQKLLYTHKLNEKEVLLLSGRYINDKSPQTYVNNQFLFADLFEDENNIENVGQFSQNTMDFYGTEIEYKNRKENKNLIEVVVGATYRKDQLESTFQLIDENEIRIEPEDFQNLTNYEVLDFYAKGDYLYKLGENLNLTGKIEAHQLMNSLENINQVNQNQDFFYLQPQLGIRWKLNDQNTLLGSYTYSTNNASIIDVYPNNILTNFRGFILGFGKPTQLNSSNYILNYRLGNFGDKFFANASVNYIQNHDFFSNRSFIQQEFQINEKILIENQELFSANTTVDRYIKAISSNLKLKLNYSQTNFINFVNQSGQREIKNQSYSYGLELRSGFLSGFNYHVGTEFRTSEVKTLQNNFSNTFSNTDNFTFLDLSYVFSDRFNMSLNTEYYYFGNLESDNDYYFSDLSAMYITKNKKLNFGLSAKNLFDTRTFRNFNITDISTSTTSYRLLPRIILLNVNFKF